jgi:hypothetical protein
MGLRMSAFYVAKNRMDREKVEAVKSREDIGYSTFHVSNYALTKADPLKNIKPLNRKNRSKKGSR